MRRALPQLSAWGVCAVAPAATFAGLRARPAWGVSLAAPHAVAAVVGGACALGLALAAAGLAARRHRTGDVIRRLTARDPFALIESGYPEFVRSFATSVEARDRYTHGHGRRVAILAVLIGRELGLPPDELRALSEGALLHDVGKIAVPDAVLNKPGALTNDEIGLIQQHPSQGAAMLSSMLHGRVEHDVIRHHHEWFDGTGYPDGLAGEAIPLGARITAVADVYDALRSTRAYRPAWTAAEARVHIHEQGGTHFDPVCVAAFDAVVARFEREYSWEVEQRRDAIDRALAPTQSARAA